MTFPFHQWKCNPKQPSNHVAVLGEQNFPGRKSAIDVFLSRWSIIWMRWAVNMIHAWFKSHSLHRFVCSTLFCLFSSQCIVRFIHNFLVQLVSRKNVHSIIIFYEASIIKRSTEGLEMGANRHVCVLKACLYRVHQSRRKKKKRKENCVDENHFCNGDRAHVRRKMLEIFSFPSSCYISTHLHHHIDVAFSHLASLTLGSCLQFYHLRIVAWKHRRRLSAKIRRINRSIMESPAIHCANCKVPSMVVYSESCEYHRGKPYHSNLETKKHSFNIECNDLIVSPLKALQSGDQQWMMFHGEMFLTTTKSMCVIVDHSESTKFHVISRIQRKVNLHCLQLFIDSYEKPSFAHFEWTCAILVKRRCRLECCFVGSLSDSLEHEKTKHSQLVQTKACEWEKISPDIIAGRKKEEEEEEEVEKFKPQQQQRHPEEEINS